LRSEWPLLPENTSEKLIIIEIEAAIKKDSETLAHLRLLLKALG
jgi:hypothetical protein